MGLNASTIPGDDGGIVSELTSPLNEDWITQHAEACALTIVEVDRMWLRFQQLGCDQNGFLYAGSVPSETIADPFIGKILKQFPKTHEGAIGFQMFCTASKWMADESVVGKIGVVFNVLNNGAALDHNILVEILSQVYLEDSQESIKRAAHVLLKQIDKQGHGVITEDQFTSWVKTLPQDTLRAILNFSISQSELSSNKDGVSPATTSSQSGPATKVPRTTSLIGPTVTDRELMKVAESVFAKDWLMFANKLGFTQREVKTIQEAEPIQKQQVEKLLREWKHVNGVAATVSTLKRALADGNFGSVAETL